MLVSIWKQQTKENSHFYIAISVDYIYSAIGRLLSIELAIIFFLYFYISSLINMRLEFIFDYITQKDLYEARKYNDLVRDK